MKTTIKRNKLISRREILAQLMKQFKPLDFQALAFPEVKKLKEKHYLILVIENVLKVSKKNKWFPERGCRWIKDLANSTSFILIWNGKKWNEIDKKEFKIFLGEAAEKMGVDKDTARFYQFRNHLFKQFLTMSYSPKPEIH